MKKSSLLAAAVAVLLALAVPTSADACTDFLFTRGATKDGSTIITYMADSYGLYGELYYHSPKQYPAGKNIELYRRNGVPQISIPQVNKPFNVVAYINDHQVAMGESTFTGRRECWNTPMVGVDYGTMIWIVLQRAKSAREAIAIMTGLFEQYGYCNNGESFSISDTGEVWILELMSKRAKYDTINGQPVLRPEFEGYTDGVVWVARRIPDGYISGHANQARITTFPQESRPFIKAHGKGLHKAISSKHMEYIYEPEVECVYSHDVISFARMHGWFTGKDKDFSFADTYNPPDFETIRACDARIYSMFLKMNKNVKKYERYAMGDATAERLPLWIKPDHKVDIKEVMKLTRDHYEGLPMDMTQGIGAGTYGCPYRSLPLRWDFEGHRYVNERPVSTQQTGFSLIAQCRSWLPDKIGGILWFGVDDTYSTVYCPIHCGITTPPECFRQGNGSLNEYSPTSAFWLFNRVANYAYGRYRDMIVDIQKVQDELENDFISDVEWFDLKFRNVTGKKLENLQNQFANSCAQMMMHRWNELDQHLLMKFHDGIIREKRDDHYVITPESFKNYPDDWYRAVVNERGPLIRYPEAPSANSKTVPDNY